MPRPKRKTRKKTFKPQPITDEYIHGLKWGAMAGKLFPEEAEILKRYSPDYYQEYISKMEETKKCREHTDNLKIPSARV